jgi:hypothetical protein
MRRVVHNEPPVRSCCQVCSAVRELVSATDGVINAGLNPAQPVMQRHAEAVALWDYARNGRHTGPVHTPEVNVYAGRMACAPNLSGGVL